MFAQSYQDSRFYIQSRRNKYFDAMKMKCFIHFCMDCIQIRYKHSQLTNLLLILSIMLMLFNVREKIHLNLIHNNLSLQNKFHNFSHIRAIKTCNVCSLVKVIHHIST